MVGDGPDRPEAHRLARELGLERHVTFLGKQDHVERLFPEMHVLLMPSEMESFGLGALEGMACGVPPVATRVGGLPELVTDGVDGFLEPVGDIAGAVRPRHPVANRRNSASADGTSSPPDCRGALRQLLDHPAV